jgi:1,4-dihydroxy-2-naphthoate octaprenyltransferase
MNVSMWAKALQVMPRVSKEEWAKLDIIARWLVATRSAALVLSFMAAAIAGILAFRDGAFDFVLWLLLTVGLVMAHGTNNFLNDLVDYLKGVDKDNYFRTQYGPQPLVSGLMSIKELLTYAAVTGLIAVACGAYLVSVRGVPALVLMAIGAFFVLFYTFPLKHIGLGELAVLLVWGPLMIAGGYYTITGQWNWNVVIASFPFGLGVASAIFGKHIDKYVADKEKQIRTLPVLIGERNARYGALLMMVLQYVVVIYLVVVRYFTPAMLLVLLALPTLRYVFVMFRQPRPQAPPDNYPANVWPLWFVASSFYHSRQFGGYFLIGLLIDTAIHLMGWWV